MGSYSFMRACASKGSRSAMHGFLDFFLSRLCTSKTAALGAPPFECF